MVRIPRARAKISMTGGFVINTVCCDQKDKLYIVMISMCIVIDSYSLISLVSVLSLVSLTLTEVVSILLRLCFGLSLT